MEKKDFRMDFSCLQEFPSRRVCVVDRGGDTVQEFDEQTQVK